MHNEIHFTDSDGDRFTVFNIRRGFEDGDCVRLSISMNEKAPIETLEWLDGVGELITDHDSHLYTNHSSLGAEAIDSIHSSLEKWLEDTKEQQIDDAIPSSRPEGISESEWKAHQERLAAKSKPVDPSSPAPASPKI